MWTRGSQSWWVWGVRACIALFFGLLELFYPAPTLLLAILLYGAFNKIDGLLSIMIAAYWLRTPSAPPLLGAGAIGVVSGIFALIWPAIDEHGIAAILGVAAIVRGGLEVVHVSRVRPIMQEAKPAFVAALLISVYGIVILLGSRLGLSALVMAFAVYTTAAGVCYFYTALRLRHVERATAAAG